MFNVLKLPIVLHIHKFQFSAALVIFSKSTQFVQTVPGFIRLEYI
jgi:hypothetical protein